MNVSPNAPHSDDELSRPPPAEAGQAAHAAPAAHERPASSPILLDELARQVTERLQALQARAAAVDASYRKLLDRGAALDSLRDATQSLIDRNHPELERLVGRERNVVGERVEEMSRVAEEFRAEVELRRVAADGLDDQVCRSDATRAATAAEWFQHIQSQRRDYADQVEKLRQWLGEAEARWSQSDETPSKPNRRAEH